MSKRCVVKSNLPAAPFRWDVRKNKNLGRLTERDMAKTHDGFEEQLRDCAAKVISSSGDSNFYFIGRSPENLFDYLSGIFYDTSWRERFRLVHLSLRGPSPNKLLGTEPQTIECLRDYFQKLDLNPDAIIATPRTLAFVDVVYTGQTFGNLTQFLRTWCKELRRDWPATHRKFKYIGMTRQEDTSPNTWRWQQNAKWMSSVPKATIKNVSIPPDLWNHLGNGIEKTTPSFSWRYWGAEELEHPRRSESQLAALCLAVYLFEKGRLRTERGKFCSLLQKQRGMRENWFRSLVIELQKSGGL